MIAYRVLGIAESFSINPPVSFLAGIVMRRDFTIDGISVTNITVGGSDATESVISLYSNMKRDDISLIMIQGCLLSMFNIAQGNKISTQTGLPVLCLASKEGKDLESLLQSHENSEKIKIYRSIGKQACITLKTGYKSWIRAFGLTAEEAVNIINDYTVFGRVPEPIRVAKLFSRACLRNYLAGKDLNNI